MPNTHNLQPIRTKSEAREKGRNGGIKSGEIRREKKLLSQVYADYLAKEHHINIEGNIQTYSGHEIVANVINRILSKGESCSVAMLKEIREATEGKDAQAKEPVLNTIVVRFAEDKEALEEDYS